MRSRSGKALTFVLVGLPWVVTGSPEDNPHYDSTHGVLRVSTTPSTRGECNQCHPAHGTDELGANPEVLFGENTNALAFFSQGAVACHQARPTSYPLGEADRMPETDSDAGYFEANAGGVRAPGLDSRGRWPGQTVWSDPAVTPSGHFVSPHAWDPDMPRLDPSGEASCHNCHDPHGGSGRFDLLVAQYGGISGHASIGPPAAYDLCFSCHSSSGALGMDPESRRIRDYFDPALNGSTAGHQIRLDSDVVLSWPANVQPGDMLPCYDCHNPHGSQGGNGAEPNAFALSDQRPEWSGLTDTLNDPAQARRFCLGCHVTSDGIPGSQSVEGILMNALPDESGHDSMNMQSCHDCHGRDYSSATGFNVHHPNGDPEGGPQDGFLESGGFE